MSDVPTTKYLPLEEDLPTTEAQLSPTIKAQATEDEVPLTLTPDELDIVMADEENKTLDATDSEMLLDEDPEEEEKEVENASEEDPTTPKECKMRLWVVIVTVIMCCIFAIGFIISQLYASAKE